MPGCQRRCRPAQPLQDLWGDAASEMLTVQYRMNSAIMDWSSQVGGRVGATCCACRARYMHAAIYHALVCLGMRVCCLLLCCFTRLAQHVLLPLHTHTSRTRDFLPPQELYGGRLSAHASVAQHTMAGVPGAGAAAAELPVLLLIDTAGCDMEEQAEEEGDSKVGG